MKGIILLADYFEDTEALATIDVLIRAGEDILRVGVNHKEVFTQTGLKVICDTLLDDINYDDFDYLILPGGKASFTILNKDIRVEKIIDYFVKQNKLVASICAAPHLLARKGYFKNREFTCYPGFEKHSIAGQYTSQGVVRDDKFVTAKSMYYSIEFALNIIAFLYGEDRAYQVKMSLIAE